MSSDQEVSDKYFKYVIEYTYPKNIPKNNPELKCIGYIDVNTGRWTEEKSKFVIFWYAPYYMYCDIEKDNLEWHKSFCSVLGLLYHYKKTYM
jgi:hypothetical protein